MPPGVSGNADAASALDAVPESAETGGKRFGARHPDLADIAGEKVGQVARRRVVVGGDPGFPPSLAIAAAVRFDPLDPDADLAISAVQGDRPVDFLRPRSGHPQDRQSV